MNEQRLTAYGKLIQQLLECPQGKEPNILQNHQHLIDEGLVAEMQQYAQHLAEADQKNNAQWLLNMAEKLTELLNQNEQRLAAYIQLIQQLLECPEGEEPNILQNHQHLIDEGLIAVMQQYAQHLAEAGKKNNAQWLLNMAEMLTKWLNQSQNPVSVKSYITLLQQLIPAEYEVATGKADKSIVYHILDNNRHLLDDNLARILPQDASDFITKFPEDTDTTVALIENLSVHIDEFPRGDRKAQIEIAIAGYLFVLSHRQENTEKWAQAQNNLGNAYRDRIRGDRAQNLENAIAAYHLALEVYTKQDFPYQWAMTQNNLATAYSDRIKGERAENLENAIAAYHLALSVYTKQDFPIDWSITQNNLAATYSNRIRGDRAQNLENAITAYNLALEVRTKQDLPIDWAMTQNNLASAYSKRIRGERAQNLENAIAAYHLALSVRTKQNFPRQWAMTQYNLASAYRNRIKGERAQNLENAITAYNLALEVSTKQDLPIDWAMTQYNLGNAYSDRIRGDQAQNLENAIASCNLALEVYTKQDFPIEWAQTQHNLAIAYRKRIRGDWAQNLENAIASCNLALAVYTKQDFPIEWAQTQNNLGNAYSDRIREDQEQNLENAIAAYHLALEVYTKTDFPRQWAMTQMNLGAAYSKRIRGERAQNLEKAVAAYHLALEVHTKKDFPRQWAMTQMNLGAAYLYRIKGDRVQNLEKAIVANKLALEVYTKKDFPIEWAMTQMNLGIVYRNRISGNKAENIENAIVAFNLVLEVHTQQKFPNYWAMTQINLGVAYLYRIRGDQTQNLENAIVANNLALELYTKKDFPIEWAQIQHNLGTAYRDRIRGDRAENMENAIAAFNLVLEVHTQQKFPNYWAMTQNNLGLAYSNRIRGDRADNLENAIACYQTALRVVKPETLPAECLTTSCNLAKLASEQKNYQLAIDNYEIAITAIEQSRDWIPDEIARQKILRDNIYVYENMIQASVSAEQYDKALETIERFRCRRLLDLILTKDLYKNGEVPEDIRKLEAEMEEKQREIDYLHRQLQTPEDKREMIGASRHVTRDQWDDITEEIQKLMTAKREIWQQMRRLDPVLAEGKQAPSVSVEGMKEFLNPPSLGKERDGAGGTFGKGGTGDDVALLSFYTTRNDTYIFILTQAEVKLHRCQGEGLENFQMWLRNNWLTPYSQIDNLAVLQAAANLAKCDIDAIESINPKPSNVIVKLKDGTTTEISFSDFDASRKQQKRKLYKQWQDKMEGMLKELADRLQINQLIEKLTDIKEIILVPFMYLHQIPLPALPLDNGEYLGDKFRVRIAPSTQVLTFCRQQPQNREANLPRYGIVENTRDDLPYTPKECELVAQIYGVAPQHHLKGSKEATKAKYKQLLTRDKVLGLLSSHHAKSNLTEPLESKLLLGDTDLTLGELLNASIRFPQLGDLFLSCCETALGNSELTDDIFTLSAAFLSAGASNVISSLWAVNDLATTILSYFYHRNRAQGIPSADALWQAQMELKELTLAKAEENLEDAEAVLEEFEGNHYTVRASCSPVKEENPEAVLEEFEGNHPMQTSCSPVKEENPEAVLEEFEGNHPMQTSCSPVKEKNPEPVLEEFEGNHYTMQTSSSPVKEKNPEPVLEEFEGNHYTVRASCSPVKEENPEVVLEEFEGNHYTMQTSSSPVKEEEFAGNHPVRASCSPETPETPETLGNTEETPETPGNTEYEEKQKIADNCQKVYDLVEEAQKLIGGEKPFNHPYYWAGFVCQGEG